MGRPDERRIPTGHGAHPLTACPDCGTPVTKTDTWGRVLSCPCGWTIMGAMHDTSEAQDPACE